jgi:hypothetical protein
MIKYVRDLKEAYSWVNFGNFVFIATKRTVAEIIGIISGSIIALPWYSYIGFVIIVVSLLFFLLDIYDNIKSKIDFMNAVNLLLKYLKRKKIELDGGVLESVFFQRDSFYTPRTKEIVLRIIEACKNGEVSLFGDEGLIKNQQIPYYEIDSEKFRFAGEYPVLCDFSGNEVYKNLSLNKTELIKWIERTFK